MRDSDNHPLYSIGVISELLYVHPETVRTWERVGIIRPPERRSGRRVFSENDLKRLQFVRKLTEEGLTVRAILYHLKFYPCWEIDECTDCANRSKEAVYAKPCWRESDYYCQAPSNENLCQKCNPKISPKPCRERKAAPGNHSTRK